MKPIPMMYLYSFGNMIASIFVKSPEGGLAMRESYNASYFHVHKFFLADIGDCLGIAQSVYDLRVNVW